MLMEPLSDNEIRRNFDSALAAAIHSGELPTTDTGLDDDTVEALYDVARKSPKPAQALIDRAKRCFVVSQNA